MGRVVEGVDPKDLKSLADQGKKAVGSGVVAFVAVSPDGKGAVVVGVTDDLTRKFSAIDLVRAGSTALGGKGGGGRVDMAQAGGPDGSKAQAALKAVGSRARRLGAWPQHGQCLRVDLHSQRRGERDPARRRPMHAGICAGW